MKSGRNNNEKKNNEKIATKICFMILFSLLMPTIAGVVIGVKEVTNQATIYFIQFSFIFLGCLILIGIMKKSAFSKENLKLNTGHIDKWMVGLILVEAVAFIEKVNLKIDIITVVCFVLFMISVGFFEELIYRGMILQYLNKKSTKGAIVLSSFLFGIGHIVNLLGGADLKVTIAQIIFAVLFGFVCAEILFLSNSIIVGIIWHSLHNIISQLTMETSIRLELITVTLQCVILLLFAFYLWKKLKNNQIIK